MILTLTCENCDESQDVVDEGYPVHCENCGYELDFAQAEPAGDDFGAMADEAYEREGDR